MATTQAARLTRTEAITVEREQELRYDAGWVPAMAPGPDPDEADEATCGCAECVRDRQSQMRYEAMTEWAEVGGWW